MKYMYILGLLMSACVFNTSMCMNEIQGTEQQKSQEEKKSPRQSLQKTSSAGKISSPPRPFRRSGSSQEFTEFGKAQGFFQQQTAAAACYVYYETPCRGRVSSPPINTFSNPMIKPIYFDDYSDQIPSSRK